MYNVQIYNTHTHHPPPPRHTPTVPHLSVGSILCHVQPTPVLDLKGSSLSCHNWGMGKGNSCSSACLQQIGHNYPSDQWINRICMYVGGGTLGGGALWGTAELTQSLILMGWRENDAFPKWTFLDSKILNDPRVIHIQGGSRQAFFSFFKALQKPQKNSKKYWPKCLKKP